MKKIVHTADWHLGAKLGPKGRLDEQKGFLDWLCGLLAAETPRAVSPTVVYDGADMDFSNGVSARNFRTFRMV